MKVVLAVDKFKGSASAREAGAALGRGLHEVRPDLEIVEAPVADGGDGSLTALLSAGFTAVPVNALGPLGRPRLTRFGIRRHEAFIELAEVCGIQLLPPGVLRPWSSGTYGLGQAILSAVDHGARRIVVGLGGSASTDGGVGMLLALGAQVNNESLGAVTPDAAGMTSATSLDLRGLDPRLADVAFVAATDVSNPLTGPNGAARVFAPQKGASKRDVKLLEEGLKRWSSQLLAASGRMADVAGAGAAGGVAAAIVAGLDGTVKSGAALVLDSTGFDKTIAGASLVVTGEGSWDAQTAAGKAPSHVLHRASRAGVPTAVVAGRIDPEVRFPSHVLARTALVELEPNPDRAMARVLELLEAVGRDLGRILPRQLQTT